MPWQNDLSLLREAVGSHLEGGEEAASRLEWLIAWQEAELDRLRDRVAELESRAADPPMFQASRELGKAMSDFELARRRLERVVLVTDR